MMHVTDNWETRKRKTYADAMKVTQTQPLVSENISSHVNEKDSENQFDLEKIKSLLINDESSSNIVTKMVFSGREPEFLFFFKKPRLCLM